MAQNSYILTGGNGGVLIDDTNANTNGPFIAIQAVGGSGATIDVSGMTTSNIDDFDADFTIPDGATIYGRFPSVQLTAGKVIAYYARNAGRV